MDVEEFYKWIDDHDVKDRTHSDFWGYLENYKKELPEEYDEVFEGIDTSFLSLSIKSIGFKINYEWDEPIKFIVCFLKIEYEGEEIGEYECLFTLDGEDMDDYLRIDRES